ncbi:hypothetical protein [Taibaiella koreensis]|uniref:hypothetical protein n=1 Tax=Taibaiella koreensis TaxID=1268548 RepID=UPI000E59FEC3|nr:hypothetical protein [Taibaiella koreensis]
MALSWIAPVAEGIVKIIGGIFSNKSKSDAAKVAQDSAARAQQAYVVQQYGETFQSMLKDTNQRYLELGRKLKATVLGGPPLTDAEMAEYERLKAAEAIRKAPFNDKLNKIAATAGQANAITSPDGGFMSGIGSSDNPISLGNTDIVATSPKTAGMSPWLILALAGGGVYMLASSGSKNKRRSKRRR